MLRQLLVSVETAGKPQHALARSRSPWLAGFPI